MKAVITVIGRDTVGVIARVSAVCAELNINIEDVTQSILQDMFCTEQLCSLSRVLTVPCRKLWMLRQRPDLHAEDFLQL